MDAARGRGRPKAKPTRRSNGDDTLYYEADRGKWVAQGVITGLGRRKVRGASEAEAWAKLAELRKGNARFDLNLNVPTVAQLAEEWLINYEQGVEASTFSTREQRIRQHIVDDKVIGGRLVCDVRPEDVEAWRLAIVKAGYVRNGVRSTYSASHIARLRSDLSRIFVWGLRRRTQGLDWNPVAAIDPLRIDEPETTKRTLTPDQARRLIEEAASSTRRYGAYVLGALLLGARPGEITGLTWDRIDFDAGTITIDQALKRRSGGVPIGLGPTKTKEPRTLHAPTIVLDALTMERKLQDELRAHAAEQGFPWPAEWDGLVFLGIEGRPPSRSNLNRSLRLIASDAGLDAEVIDLESYELRHTCASLLDDAGVPLSQILDQMGWANARMFYKHYRHKVGAVSGRAGAAMWEAMLVQPDG